MKLYPLEFYKLKEKIELKKEMLLMNKLNSIFKKNNPKRKKYIRNLTEYQNISKNQLDCSNISKNIIDSSNVKY